MFAMLFQREAFDVVWAEGAIYALGFDRALTEWRTLLRAKRDSAATHLSWLVTDVPSQPRAFWELNYPAIRHVDENVEICARSGFYVVDRFTLPESAWWIDYYGPMEARIIALREECAGDDEAMAVITAAGEEIDLYRRFSASYGYVFYILRVQAS